MSLFPLKPTHKPVKDYYAALAQFNKLGHKTEGNTRSAFADLLKKSCQPYRWHLVESLPFRGTGKQRLIADGAIEDALGVVQGIWEAKDDDDELDKEIKLKVAAGYPLTNIIFQSPSRAVLYQNSRIEFDESITTPEKLLDVLKLFLDYTHPEIPDWKDAVEQFSEKIAELSEKTTKILISEQSKNPDFREKFGAFAELCRQSINPDLDDDAIRKMLVQHLLTERIFRKVFNNQEFLQRNVIAVEIEKVIKSITDHHFSRDTFLKSLDRYYKAIERAAEANEGYSEKQTFLNNVYEKFFQRFDKKQADTHGIVYTPQPIVDFMVRSVEEILQQEFGKSLSDTGVHILDPFTGTGNFITRIMQQMKRSALPKKYAEELHCNEIMLLPYYIASMNIEHAYMERLGKQGTLGEYRPFEGICLADTFDMTGQGTLFSPENTKRIKRQMDAPIRVVIGNPPYNVGQANENDQNKNRSYDAEGGIDSRVAKTYTSSSKATLRSKLSDPYVKAFRWATDRIRDNGVVCLVTNSSFVDMVAYDGMRQHLMRDFSKIYIIDLGGNVVLNPKLSGTTHNVFGIKVGVAITVLIRHKNNDTQELAQVFYARTPTDWRKGQKYDQLRTWTGIVGAACQLLCPDEKYTWLTEGQQDEFTGLLPLDGDSDERMFAVTSLGISTNRDEWIYGFDRAAVKATADRLRENFMSERARFFAATDKENFVVNSDGRFVKWSESLLRKLKSEQYFEGDCQRIQTTLYRPFCKTNLVVDSVLIDRPSQQAKLFPNEQVSNICISASDRGHRAGWSTLASSCPADLHLCATADGFQCFGFHTFDEDGTNRRENITDWSLNQFRSHYSDDTITKWEIFHATYAILHHPEYRTHYAANLRRELPRIPFPPDFHTFAAAGKRLMELHIDYEKQPEHPLQQIEDDKAEVTFRVERMRINPKDKSELRYNDFLTLRGIPLDAYNYRLGNRSALEWVVDQYRVSTDARSGIVNDPNREDDDRYILRLIGQVITVSLETNKIVASLPTLNLGD